MELFLHLRVVEIFSRNHTRRKILDLLRGSAFQFLHGGCYGVVAHPKRVLDDKRVDEA